MSGRITFWYGCNVLRHGDIIHICVDILGRLGFDVRLAGGPDYCCGNGKDANLTAADGMANRTVTKFNNFQRDQVVAWCPSCHTHMTDFMGQAYKTGFSLDHLVNVLYEHRDALSAFLKHSVPMRVLLHKHMGFNGKVEVNAKVPVLLRLIPGIEVIEDGYAAPGYQCLMLATVLPAMEDMVARTLRLADRHHADAVVTVFHQCHRALCGLEGEVGTKVFNYVHLLAQSMGLNYPDEYKEWKKSGPRARTLIGEPRIAKVGVQFFERAVLPELVKRTVGLSPKSKDRNK
ncbi:MAG: hypothetical protein HY525_19145 [Betaproteobacteria bacterium]|nr:hypothetical protein [Betaproteobacteria bacterium]